METLVKQAMVIICLNLLVLFYFSANSLADEKASGLHWEEYWQRVEAGSPKIKAFDAGVKAVSAEIPLELPPPTVTLGTMGETSPWSGVMEQRIEATQKIPFPTKFIQAAHVKAAKVDFAKTERQFELRRIKERAAQLFIRLYGLEQAERLFAEKQKTLESHLKRLRGLTLTSQVQKIHILETEGELKLLVNEIRQRDLEESVVRRELGVLAGENEAFSETVLISDLLPPEPLPESLAENREEVRQSQKIENWVAAERSLTRQAWIPDLVLTYGRRERLDDVMPSSHEAMIGIEIPFLWAWQPTQKNRRASFLAEKAQADLAQAQREIYADVALNNQKLEILWEQLSNLRQNIVPSFEHRVHLLHRIIPTDLAGLELHLKTLIQLVDQKLKMLSVETTYRELQTQLAIQKEFTSKGMEKSP